MTVDQVFTTDELKGQKFYLPKILRQATLRIWGTDNLRFLSFPKVQLSPIYGVNTGDFDQDGNLDIVMGGNFTASG